MAGGQATVREAVVQLNAATNRLPAWLRRPIAGNGLTERVRGLVAEGRLHTVCQSARCPNLSECFGHGTATFMILGDVCTRRCSFCAVTHGAPLPVEPDEGVRIGMMAQALGLTYVVVTSVARDDLTDGGASHFARVIEQIRTINPDTAVEVLVPDFQGRLHDVDTVLAARPDVFNHNIETVTRLQRRLRSAAQYERSLAVLDRAAQHGCITKSGLMLGVGETNQEVVASLQDLRRVGCEMVTIGQYLRSAERKLPVAAFVAPEQFARYHAVAEAMGFAHVASGPYVRSSYRAAEAWRAARAARARRTEEMPR